MAGLSRGLRKYDSRLKFKEQGNESNREMIYEGKKVGNDRAKSRNLEADRILDMCTLLNFEVIV